MSKKHASTYARFLSLASEIHDLDMFPKLDPVEERVLNTLAAAWHTGDKTPVLKVMVMFKDISGTTVHRRLKSLRRKGMIELRPDDVDDRIRYVAPTRLTDNYFERLGRYLEKAARG